MGAGWRVGGAAWQLAWRVLCWHHAWGNCLQACFHPVNSSQRICSQRNKPQEYRLWSKHSEGGVKNSISQHFQKQIPGPPPGSELADLGKGRESVYVLKLPHVIPRISWCGTQWHRPHVPSQPLSVTVVASLPHGPSLTECQAPALLFPSSWAEGLCFKSPPTPSTVSCGQPLEFHQGTEGSWDRQEQRIDSLPCLFSRKTNGRN